MKKNRRAELLKAWKDLLNLKEKRLEMLKENMALDAIETDTEKSKDGN